MSGPEYKPACQLCGSFVTARIRSQFGIPSAKTSISHSCIHFLPRLLQLTLHLSKEDSVFYFRVIHQVLLNRSIRRAHVTPILMFLDWTGSPFISEFNSGPTLKPCMVERRPRLGLYSLDTVDTTIVSSRNICFISLLYWLACLLIHACVCVYICSFPLWTTWGLCK